MWFLSYKMGDCELLSEDQRKKILERYTKTKDFKIESYCLSLLKAQLDGLIGEQYNVKINYRTDEKKHLAQFFLKALDGSNRVMFEISKSIYAFEKESFYYETLTPLLREKQLDFDVAPKSYLCEPYIVVLEDLSLLSYTGTIKNTPLDLKHCKKCLETIAKFHVGPILYERAKSADLGKNYNLLDQFKDILEDKVFSQEVNGATKFIRGSIEGLFQLINLIPENGVSNTAFIAKLQDLLNDVMASKDDSMGFRCTVQHGDLWSNNFLYQYDNNEITDCKLIDFQTLKYGPPAMDVLSFILTNTRKSFRDEHQKELITHYYNYFGSLLAARGFSVEEILTAEEFKKSCEVFMLPAKIQALVDRSITVTSDENFVEAARTEESFLKYIFEDRGKYMVNSFNENQYFRELMMEDISELREILFD